MWRPSGQNEARFPKFLADLPPEALVAQQKGTKIILDDAELQRAKWFWEQRPGKLPGMRNVLKVILFCLILYVAGLCFYQQIMANSLRGFIVSAFFSTIVVAHIHIYRYARWKADYWRSISRLVQNCKQ
jgi:hypothetical protein